MVSASFVFFSVCRLLSGATLLGVALFHPAATSAVYLALFLAAHQGSVRVQSPLVLLIVTALAIVTAITALVLRFSAKDISDTRLVPTSGLPFLWDIAVLVESIIYLALLLRRRCQATPSSRNGESGPEASTGLIGFAAAGVFLLLMLATALQPCLLGLLVRLPRRSSPPPPQPSLCVSLPSMVAAEVPSYATQHTRAHPFPCSSKFSCS